MLCAGVLMLCEGELSVVCRGADIVCLGITVELRCAECRCCELCE